MKSTFILALLAIVIFNKSNFQTCNGEKYDEKKYRIEIEKIFNKIFNSMVFDSIYHNKKVIFIENEILSNKFIKDLRRGKCKVIIKKKEEINKDEVYLVLGDFTSDPNKMTAARIQIENPKLNLLLNIRMELTNGEWQIVDHVIMEE